MSKMVMTIVEGQSEEDFVTYLLSGYIENRTNGAVKMKASQVITNPILMKRGGGSSYKHYIPMIENYLASPQLYCTTIIDFYKFPTDVDGIDTLDSIYGYYEKAEQIERLMKAEINTEYADRFIPNVLLHEFEALLLTDCSAFEAITTYKRGDIQKLQKEINREFTNNGENPEFINQGETTAPSKRILKYLPYRKGAHGYQIATRITIDRIRDKCKHFDVWIRNIEALGESI